MPVKLINNREIAMENSKTAVGKARRILECQWVKGNHPFEALNNVQHGLSLAQRPSFQYEIINAFKVILRTG